MFNVMSRVGSVVVMWWWRPAPVGVPVRVPELSAEAQAGKHAFDLYCAPVSRRERGW